MADILALLPPELALHILVLLCSSHRPSANTILNSTNLDHHSDPFPAIIACLGVSKTWRRLASDNSVWRALFAWRWGKVSERRVEEYLIRQQRQNRRKQGIQMRKSALPNSFRSSSIHRRSVGIKELTLRDKKLPPLPAQGEASGR